MRRAAAVRPIAAAAAAVVVVVVVAVAARGGVEAEAEVLEELLDLGREDEGLSVVSSRRAILSRRKKGTRKESPRRGATSRRAATRQGDLGRKRVIQRRFNVAVPRARVPKKDVHGRDRSER